MITSIELFLFSGVHYRLQNAGRAINFDKASPSENAVKSNAQGVS